MKKGKATLSIILSVIFLSMGGCGKEDQKQVPDSRHNKLVSLIFDEDDIPMLLTRDEDGYYIRRVRTTDGEEYEPSRLEIGGNDFYNLETSRIAKQSYYDQNGINIMIYKCEPEDVEIIRELVDSVSNKFQYNIEIQNIIDEEVAAYLHDQKSMEEVCSIIQSRVQLYLDERK